MTDKEIREYFKGKYFNFAENIGYENERKSSFKITQVVDLPYDGLMLLGNFLHCISLDVVEVVGLLNTGKKEVGRVYTYSISEKPLYQTLK